MKIFWFLNKLLLSIFFERKYLRGKYFDDSRWGYLWCYRSLSRIFKLRRRGIRFPVGKNTRISNGRNIVFDNSSLNVFQQPGCYFQNESGNITIGKNVHIAANVVIITANHNPENPDEHLPAKDVVIGDHCWIGMNAMILPGVTLGDYTTVGAGSVVTRNCGAWVGHCIIAGNPAKVIKTFDKEKHET